MAIDLFCGDHKKRLPTIRIQKIVLDNFKSIRHGEVLMDCGKRPVPAGESSDILGIYGQNGSGKTSVIEALAILKQLVSGGELHPYYSECIAIGSEFSRLEFTFDLQYPDGKQRKVVYSFEMKALIDSAEEEVESPGQEPEDGFDSVFKAMLPNGRVVVFNEKILMSGPFEGRGTKLQPVIDTSPAEVDVPFIPLSKRRFFLGNEDNSTIMELAMNKRSCEENSRSFIFSSKTRVAMRKSWPDVSVAPSDYYEVLVELYWFAFRHLFVIGGKTPYSVPLSRFLPLYSSGISAHRYDPFANAFFSDADEREALDAYNREMQASGAPSLLPTEAPFPLPVSHFEAYQSQLETINMVVSELIPGMSVALKEIAPMVGPDGSESVLAQLVSSRDGVEMPFGHESEGVQRIVSSLMYLIRAFNQKSTTVAIDEFDAGIFEYLLGEILEAIQSGGVGQFIFTSHNLRPLEVLNKRFICFTTTNPDNRFARLKNVGASNNLRNVYFREIVMGEQDEEFYRYTQQAKIESAFRRAGGSGGAA